MKKKLLLNFSNSLVNKPITYSLINKYNLEINILRAFIDNSIKGTLLLQLNGNQNDIEAAIEYLSNTGVCVDIIESTISIDENECVHCGACTSVCTVNALKLDKDTWKLVFNSKKCLECKNCIDACPVGSITSII